MSAKTLAWTGLALLVTASAALAPPASATTVCHISIDVAVVDGLTTTSMMLNPALASSACKSAGCTTTFALAQTWDTVDYPFDILGGGPFSATDDYTVDTKDNSFAYASCVL